MLFSDQVPTRADIHFSVGPFPVRIHPGFWVVSLLLAAGSGASLTSEFVAWVLATLISILAHELGHTVLQRHYGGRPSILLYSFGGLAFGNGADDRPWPQILISLAGPVAGFLLAAILLGLLYLGGQQPSWIDGTFTFEPFDSLFINVFLHYMLWINVWWGLLNLLPIYPLDGGQIARELGVMLLPPQWGIRGTLLVSLLVAAGVAGLAIINDNLYRATLFGLLAMDNYQTLLAYNHSRGSW